jgi:hypothetical protein
VVPRARLVRALGASTGGTSRIEPIVHGSQDGMVVLGGYLGGPKLVTLQWNSET